MSNKFWLVTKREYLSRVRKKTFILATILTPVGFVVFWIAMILIMTSGAETRRMALVDEGNLLQINAGHSLRDGAVTFVPSQIPLDSLRKNLAKLDFQGIVFIPANKNENLIQAKVLNVEYYTDDKLGVNTLEFIKKSLDEHIRDLKITASGIDKNVLNNLNTSVNLSPKQLDNSVGTEESSYKVYVATFLGGLMMFLIYIVIFIYGNMVMRSVMEEKTSRIVEIIISSVKPFQLMLGKIIGVGMVGLTQFAVWAIVFPLLYLGVGLMFAGRLKNLQNSPMLQGQDMPTQDMGEITQTLNELGSFNYGYILLFFVLFFLAGYILYASLFAAVGAAMGDDWGEGQSLTLVIAIPVVIAFYMGIAVIENPNSDLAFWASLFPLFSPIIMPARIVFDPPMWQILLSLGILIATCIFFIWMSGRIYRVGILMYGKKTTLRELAKWIFRRD